MRSLNDLTGPMPYDLIATPPGTLADNVGVGALLAHHSDDCPARLGEPCTCGPLGYRGTIDDAERRQPVLGPLVSTPEQARAWQRDQYAALHAFRTADSPANPPVGPPAGTNGSHAAPRPVDTHGYQAAAQPGTVAALIQEFLEAALAGDVVDPSGRPYEGERFRDLRWSLRGYVASDLGTRPIEELSGDELRAFVGRLDATGLAPARTRSVVSGLRALLRYAAQRGDVPANVADLLVFGDEDDAPYAVSSGTYSVPAAVAPATPSAPAPAPAGFVSDEVIWMILKIVTLVFALIALVLVAESV